MISVVCGIPSAVHCEGSFLDGSRNATPRRVIVNTCRVDN